MRKRLVGWLFCLWLGVGVCAPAGAWGLDAAPLRRVAVGDVVLGYRSWGTGRPLLLVTGYGCTMDAWDPTLLRALSAGGQRRVIVFDNRGMGASTASAAPFSIRRLTDDAAGLLAALGISRADVLGWSMGAIVALDLARRYPDRVDRVVAYGAAFAPGPVNAAVARFRRLTPAAFAAQLFPPAFWASHPHALELVPRPSVAPRPDMTARQRRALSAWPGFGHRLDHLTRPVLLVVGQDDTVTPPGESLRLAERIPGAWLVRLRGGGHWLMYQMPRTLARVVTAFLDAETDGR